MLLPSPYLRCDCPQSDNFTITSIYTSSQLRLSCRIARCGRTRPRDSRVVWSTELLPAVQEACGQTATTTSPSFSDRCRSGSQGMIGAAVPVQ